MFKFVYIAQPMFLTSAVRLFVAWKKRGMESRMDEVVHRSSKLKHTETLAAILWLEGNVCFSRCNVQSAVAVGFKPHCTSVWNWLTDENIQHPSIFLTRQNTCGKQKKPNLESRHSIMYLPRRGNANCNFSVFILFTGEYGGNDRVTKVH